MQTIPITGYNLASSSSDALTMNLIKTLLAAAQKRSETPADRRRRLLREVFTQTPLQTQREPGDKR